MSFAKKNAVYILAVVISVIVNIISWQFPFFWDTILTSTITRFYFENGFGDLIPPAGWDAGHPPLFYMYVVLFYKLFGLSLFSAHLSMLLITVSGAIFFVKILQYFTFSIREQLLGVTLFFSIPAVLTQNSLVSYDAALLSLFLAALYFILRGKKNWFGLVLIVLAGISLRGLIGIAALGAIVFFITGKDRGSWILSFIPAIALIGGWYIYHHSHTGWYVSTNAEGWSGQRGIVGISGLFKNMFSVGRSFFDLGIFVLSVSALIYIIQQKRISKICLIWLIPLLVFAVSFLPFSNPVNHRYFLAVYVLMLPSVLLFLRTRNVVFKSIFILLLLGGHFQLYPGKISNGWDCTMAHVPYFSVRNEMKAFLSENNIDIAHTGTVFPMNTSFYQTDLNADTVRMMNIHGKSMDNFEYLLYSNIGNDFSDQQMDALNSWKKVSGYQKGVVKMVLYRNPQFPDKLGIR